jgi:hypothetical protein
MAQDPKEDINESAAYIRDTLSSVAGVFAEQLKNATKNAFSSAEASSIRDVSRQLNQTFRELNKNVLDSRKNQDDLSKGILKTATVERQLNTLQEKRKNLAILANEARLKGIELNQEAFASAKASLDTEREQLENDLQRTQAIDKAVGASGKLASALKNIPGLGRLIDAEKLESSLRAAADAGNGTLSTFGKIKAVGGSLAASFKELFLSPEAILVFLVNAGLKADVQITKLAKSLSQTKTEAAATRDNIADIARASGDSFITTEKLVESTLKLGQQLGLASTFSADLTKEFTTLTGKIGLSEEAAGGLAKLTVATGKNARTITTEALGAARALEAQSGILFNEREILEETGKVSGQLLANFQGNPAAIAAAVTQTKLLGTTLEQTKKQSESLLNFQSSIENELKAEVITGQQLNLERARAAALAGKQEDVAKELANQNMNFSKFSRMNVLAQKDFAAALGLSADELSNQLLKQQYLGRSTKEVAALEGEAVAKRLEQQSAQDKFNQSVEKLQDIFVSLIDGPIGQLLDLFADILGLIGKISSAVSTMIPAPLLKILMGAGTGFLASGFNPIGALVGGSLAAGSELFKAANTDDMMSDYGDRTLVTPKGAYALNNSDTVIAGTNLFKGNDVYSGPKGSISLNNQNSNSVSNINNTEVVDAISKLGDHISLLSNRPVIAKPSEFTSPITMNQLQNIRRSV